jgi:YggT family protein
MNAVGVVLGTILSIFEVVLVARVVVDWAGVLAASTEPAWHSGARRFTHAVTEPVLAPVRKVLRPVLVGSVAIDLAFPVVFIAVSLLRQLVLG